MTSRVSELVTESERARLELQMLFGVHVYSRAKVVPDLALSRGEEAHRAARLQGDRAIEFLAAGGVALSLLELGDVDGAERWLGLAAAAASVGARHGARSIQLETWRGHGPRRQRAMPTGMRHHLETAVTLATEGGRAAARCEAARPARARGVPASLRPERRTRRSSSSSSDRRRRSRTLLPLLPGHAPWGAQADAASSAVAPRARRRSDRRRWQVARRFEALEAALHEDASLEIADPGGPGGAAPAARPRARQAVRGLPSADAVADRPGHRRREDPRRAG